MKTYVLTISKTFPSDHPKKGRSTAFEEMIIFGMKIHTIRGNYPFWKKRIDAINTGEAFLSVRQWSGKPYNSPQVECMKFMKGEVGIQQLEDPTNFVFAPVDGKIIDWETLAKNDGLSFEDFCEWFKTRNPNPMAIIHFTNFRY